MIITTNALLAMRCPHCGKLELHGISRFSFSGCKTLRINCSCGAVKLIISTKSKKKFWLQVSCIICETKHLATLDASSIWSAGVTNVLCEETGLELACIGSPDKVKEAAGSYRDNVEVPEAAIDGDDYFYNPEVMYKTLNCLHDIVERGALYCQCGNYQIAVDIFPDRLELYCDNCNSVNIIYAENEEDLEVIRRVESIELTRYGFKCLDSLAGAGKTKERPGPGQTKT